MVPEDNIVVRVFTAEDPDSLLKECLELRHDVFVSEQDVEESLEHDSLDAECIHIAARIPPFFDDNETMQTVGTCRLCCESPYIKLERVAVRKEWRRKNIGTIVCRTAINLAEKMYSRYLLVTQTQLHAYDFYEKLGFFSVSDTYIEANIPHKTMIYIPRFSRISDLFIWKNSINNHQFIPGECWDPKTLTVILNTLLSLKGSCQPRLLHYQHQFETKVIGASLVRAYRECAIALQKRLLKRSVKLEEFLLTVAWEKLNTGHYSLVDDAWREFYSAASACKALRLLTQGNYKDALAACDFGLMMGGDIDGQSLSVFAAHSHGLLPAVPPISCMKSSFSAPSSLPNSQPVKRVHRPSMEDFLEYFAKGEPVIITGVVTEWPAYKKWNFEHFNAVAGHRIVPVEIGSSYTSDDWKQTFMTVHDYIEEFIEKESPKGPGYLAQHRMFDQIPELLNDLILPDYYSFRSMDDVDLMIWIGPAGTVSPLHTDPKSNIFCQVYGRKFFRLVPYSESELVYRHTEGFLTNTTQKLGNHSSYLLVSGIMYVLLILVYLSHVGFIPN